MPRCSPLLLLAVVLLVVSALAAAQSCQCFAPARADEHCAASFSDRVVVVRAKVLSLAANAARIQVWDVVFNNSPKRLWYKMETTVSQLPCTPLSANAVYWLRLHVVNDALVFQPCQFVEQATSSGEPAGLSCGRPQNDCQRHPCPAEQPVCSDFLLSVTCAGPEPCPTRSCLPDSPICPAVVCPTPACAPGSVVGTLPGDCCPTCIRDTDCSNTACIALACGAGFATIIRPGECCPVCVREEHSCAAVLCPAVLCPQGLAPRTVPGECCPMCAKDCNNAACPEIGCGDGFQSLLPPDQCCPICVKAEQRDTCNTVLCAPPLCQPGTTMRVLPGSCCPSCVPDCGSDTVCPAVACSETQKQVVPFGECCPVCEADCTKINCSPLQCDAGYAPYTPRGQCCPTYCALPSTASTMAGAHALVVLAIAVAASMMMLV